MKTIIVFLAVLGLSFSAPQPRTLFHDHVEDFLDVINNEVGDELEDLFDEYLEYAEFRLSLNFMQTTDFKNLVFEMESLPEFQAVTQFLENNKIDILYFIDLFNSVLEFSDQMWDEARQQATGKDFRSFINDSIAMFPKSKLAALYDQKMSEVEDFRSAIENLQSEEWDTLWDALWDNETFQAEAKVLADNGIDLNVLLDEIIAIFGQN